jgi:hypothetical protein
MDEAPVLPAQPLNLSDLQRLPAGFTVNSITCVVDVVMAERAGQDWILQQVLVVDESGNTSISFFGDLRQLVAACTVGSVVQLTNFRTRTWGE